MKFNRKSNAAVGTMTMARTRWAALAALGAAFVGASASAFAADGPPLGAARSFAALGASTVTSTGATAVTGDVGVSPGTAIDGFPPATIANGAIHAGDATAAQAHSDAAIAYAFLAGMRSSPANNLSGTDMGGLTLKPGTYKFNDSAQLTGALVLDAKGSSSALFVIQIASSLTTSSGSTVTVINGGADYDESKVFWQVGSSATLGSGTAFTGNILAYASISLVSGATMTGNALALNGAVTMEANTITSPPVPAVVPSKRPSGGHSSLTRPLGAPDANATARIDVKHFPANHGRRERSWFKMKLRHLTRNTVYTLWADDPATPVADLVQFATFTAPRSGNVNFTLDTKKAGTMPFGATLADLSGATIEVRDSVGMLRFLTGVIPTTRP